jgi:endonuclease III
MSSIPKTLFEVTRILRARYRDFDHFNIANDPLNELIFILCSTKTSEETYRSTYRALRLRFPDNYALAAAGIDEIACVLKGGGLANKKALAIHEILHRLVRQFGQPTLDPLREMTDQDCERILVSMPGVGKKVARCVMLYALGRSVFPVDEHCWRVSKRLGWIRQTRKNRSGSPRDEDRLQNKIPPDVRFSLHVNFLSLGREICHPRQPSCNSCPLSRLCRKVGVH